VDAVGEVVHVGYEDDPDLLGDHRADDWRATSEASRSLVEANDSVQSRREFGVIWSAI
jgi:hypothetical protein